MKYILDFEHSEELCIGFTLMCFFKHFFMNVYTFWAVKQEFSGV